MLKYYVKSKELIEAKTKYSITTMRFLAFIILKINAEYIKPLRKEEENTYYLLDLQEMKDRFEINYDIEYFPEMIKSVKKELSTDILIEHINYKKITSLIKDVTIYTSEKQMKIEISNDVLPILKRQFEKYVKFGFKYLSVLNSEYAVKLYENLLLKANKKNKELQEIIFSILELKELLNFDYETYKLINYRVLKISQRQFEEQQIFKSFEYEPLYEKRAGTGRKPVNAIKFKLILGDDVIDIYSKNTQIIEITKQQDETEELYLLLPQAEQIESRKAELDKLLKKHSFEYLKSDIAYCQKKKPKEFWGYFIKSTKEGHFSTADIEKQKKKEEAKRKRIEKEEAEKREREEKEKEREILAKELIKSITKDQLEIMQSKYDNQKNIYTKTGVDFERFLIENIKANEKEF